MVVLIFVNVNGIQEVKVVPSLPGNLKIMDNYLSCSKISMPLASPCISPHRLGAGSKAKPRHALLQASHCLRRKVRARNFDRYCTNFKSKTHWPLCWYDWDCRLGAPLCHDGPCCHFYCPSPFHQNSNPLNINKIQYYSSTKKSASAHVSCTPGRSGR